MSRALIFRAAALLILGLASYWAGALAWRERTVAGTDSLSALQQAAAKEPASAERLQRLGQRAEIDEDFALAESSLLRAATLSRLYQPRYLLAQYYFRRNDEAAFAKWSREAFLAAPGDVTPLLDLAWRMKPDAGALAQQALALRPAVASQFLVFLVQNRSTRAAAKLARHLAETGGRGPLPSLLGFCEQALAEANLTDARAVWGALSRRKLLPYENGPAVTNGDFRFPTVSSAFDWHIESGARQGANAVHLTLGSGSENSVLAWQYVHLRRGTRYRLRYELEGPSDCVGWSVFYPAAGSWQEWAPARSLEFEAPAEIVRLALMCRRPTGAAVAVSGVGLDLLP